MAKPTKALAEAIAGIKPAVDALCELEARCMEQVLDRCGIVCERWILPNGKSAIVYGTPHWRDVFVPVSPSDQWQSTVDALKKFAQRAEAAQPASLAGGA
jgi:hypothetical protein